MKSFLSQVTSKALAWVTKHNVHDQHETNKYVGHLFDPPALMSLLRKPKKAEDHSSKYDVGRFRGQTLLGDSADDTSGIVYRPKTQETKQAYEFLLNFIQEAIGGQARNVLCGAADEILILLKNDRLRDQERKAEIESLLSTKVAEERFAFIVNLGKKITDWSTEEKTGQGDDDIDETYGVNVEFDGSDDEDEGDVNEVREGDEDDASEGEEAKMDFTIQDKVAQSVRLLSFLNTFSHLISLF